MGGRCGWAAATASPGPKIRPSVVVSRILCRGVCTHSRPHPAAVPPASIADSSRHWQSGSGRERRRRQWAGVEDAAAARCDPTTDSQQQLGIIKHRPHRFQLYLSMFCAVYVQIKEKVKNGRHRIFELSQFSAPSSMIHERKLSENVFHNCVNCISITCVGFHAFWFLEMLGFDCFEMSLLLSQLQNVSQCHSKYPETNICSIKKLLVDV